MGSNQHFLARKTRQLAGKLRDLWVVASEWTASRVKSACSTLPFFLALAAVGCTGTIAQESVRTSDRRVVFFATPDTGDSAPSINRTAGQTGETYQALSANSDDTPVGFILQRTVWRFEPGQPKQIPVCWETAGFDPEKSWVRDSVQSTWEAASGLRFTGWESCPAGSFAGIRIAVTDNGPHVKALGSDLRGMPTGMELNFRFLSWSPGCQRQQEFCIRAIGVHEFGHAIGFAHEQNRADTPGECGLRRQGSDGDLALTPWDLSSVMNYCNPLYSNNARLSAGDVRSVEALYCPAYAPTCLPALFQ